MNVEDCMTDLIIEVEGHCSALEVLRQINNERALGALVLCERNVRFAISKLELESLKEHDLVQECRVIFSRRSGVFSVKDSFLNIISFMMRENLDMVPVADQDRQFKALVFSEVRDKVSDSIEECVSRTSKVDEYVSMLSHDIRSPLSIISVCCDYLMNVQDNGSNLSEEQKSFIKRIDKNTDTALSLVSALLDLGALGKSRSLSYSDIRLEEFLRGLCENLNFLSTRKHVAIEVECSDNIIVSMDRERISQVLENLISNAVKFSPQSSKVVVRGETLSREGQLWVKLSIIDNGPGMSSEDANNIFSPYSQLDSGTARKLGVGLGLSIATRYVTSHGGNISVKSKIGAGSTFEVCLPGAQVAESKGSSKQKVVLLVDDDPDIREFLGGELEEFGYKVIEANDGEDGNIKYRRCAPDLVISDIQMPKSDGIELLSRLKGLDSKIPVILASGYYPKLSADLANSVFKADSFFHKPFDIKEVLSVAEQLIKKNREQDAS